MRNGNTESERRPLSLSPDSSSFRIAALPAITPPLSSLFPFQIVIFLVRIFVVASDDSSAYFQLVHCKYVHMYTCTYVHTYVVIELESLGGNSTLVYRRFIAVYRMSSFNLLNCIYTLSDEGETENVSDKSCYASRGKQFGEICLFVGGSIWKIKRKCIDWYKVSFVKIRLTWKYSF